ncbi:alpha/beta fold hydrolase [Aquiflexum sp.]|uniref:alpha/beta fold hydrolase n=1 Tax=Aquiflexum sp. TaxID=1872584 RepID=UPI003593132E
MKVLVFIQLALQLSCSDKSNTIKPEYIIVNDTKQWIYYLGEDGDKPIILFLHGGPGTPETPFLQKYNQNLAEDFIIVCWEQRGAGKSYYRKIPSHSMTIDQFIEDTHEVTRFLKQKFKRDKIYLMGHSWGTLIGIKAVKKYPQDYHAYFALAQISHTLMEEQQTYEWLMGRAMAEPNRKAIMQLKKIGLPSEENRYSLKQVSTKIKWVNCYGGAAFYKDRKGLNKLIKTVLGSPLYSFWDKLKYPKGEKFSLHHLHSEIATVNLFDEITSIKVPIVFIHGSKDYQIPLSVAKEYYEFISAPYKKFIEFEDCAHGLIIEQPGKFKEAVFNELYKINNFQNIK